MNLVKKNLNSKLISFGIASLSAILVIGGYIGKSVNASTTTDDFVYVETNIPTGAGNGIYAFKRQTDGTLQQITGSPFLTGGNGITDNDFQSLVADNDQNLIIDHQTHRLFAVNSGSNTISVFNINSDGSLTLVPGSPFPSNGVNPESVGLAKGVLSNLTGGLINDDVLYVANRNLNLTDPHQESPNTNPTYAAYRVNALGQLSLIPNSIVQLPAGAGPTQTLVDQRPTSSLLGGLLSPDFGRLFGAEFTGAQLRAFKINANGTLTNSPASPQALPLSEFPNPTELAPLPLGLQVHPNQKYLYVGFVLVDKVGVYSYDDDGKLTFIKAVHIGGKQPCWFITNKAGTRLYTGNTLDNSVTVLDITNPSSPAELQTVQLKEVVPGTGAATQLALSPDEKYLQVVVHRNSANPNGNAINVLQVNSNGTLTELPNSPLPLPSINNSFPQGIATN